MSINDPSGQAGRLRGRCSGRICSTGPGSIPAAPAPDRRQRNHHQSDRKPLERDLLIVIDEMPRLGYLKPVMDGYTMAAGKGVHFWCFAQSISALNSTWGKEHRKTLLHLAELVQILGFPRTDAEGAEALSKAIGIATFEARRRPGANGSEPTTIPKRSTASGSD